MRTLIVTAGLLARRRVTAFPSIADEMRAGGASYEDREVVVDANLVTSRRPADLPAFVDAMLRALGVGRR